MIPVDGHPGAFVRRLSFRQFGRMQAAATAGKEAGDPENTAFAAALAAAAGCDEAGDPLWADYDAAADDERAMFVAAVSMAAATINGLGDEDSGNE